MFLPHPDTQSNPDFRINVKIFNKYQELKMIEDNIDYIDKQIEAHNCEIITVGKQFLTPHTGILVFKQRINFTCEKTFQIFKEELPKLKIDCKKLEKAWRESMKKESKIRKEIKMLQQKRDEINGN